MHRTVAVFVHGLFSSPDVWKPFVQLLATDPDFHGSPAVRLFAYDTPAVRLHPARRIPTLDTVALGLETFLDSAASAGDRIVLVGHSQGGLVIQRYLARVLQDGRGQELRRIAGVVLFACPNSGSEFALTLRTGVNLLWNNPQVRALRPLADELMETQRIVLNRVVHAREAGATQYPVRITAFAGEADKVVQPASALALFPRAGVLPGDHSSIIRPDSHQHRAYLALKAELTATSTDVSAVPPQTRESPPPPSAAPATAALGRIVEALLTIDELVDGPSRRQILLYLPPHIRSVIQDGINPRMHVLAILRGCARFGAPGRAALQESLALALHTDDPAVAAAFETLEREWPVPL